MKFLARNKEMKEREGGREKRRKKDRERGRERKLDPNLKRLKADTPKDITHLCTGYPNLKQQF